MKPTISLFKVMSHKKYETELYIARKTKSLDKFHKKCMLKPLPYFRFQYLNVADAFVCYTQVVVVVFIFVSRLCYACVRVSLRVYV